jgi:hypothetical protein
MEDFSEWTPSAQYDEPGLEKRQFKRLILREKGFVCMHDEVYEVIVLSLSPKGALIDFGRKVLFRKNVRFKLSLEPANSIIALHFEGEVVQCCHNFVGLSS